MDKKYFSAPTTVNLELTELCNVKCRHCYNPWRDETMGEISLSEIKLNLLIKKLSEAKVFHVILTGGEPMSNFDVLIKAITRLTEKSISVSCNSNLILADDEKAKALRKAGLDHILTSFPSIDKDENDYIMQSKNSLDKIIRGIKACVNNGIRISANMVILRTNMDKIYETGKLAASLGCDKFFITRAVPPSYSETSKSDDSKEDLYNLSHEETKNCLDEVLRIKKDFNIRIGSLVSYPLCFLEDLDKYRDFVGRGCPSQSGHRMSINANGDLHVCVHEEESYGNVFKTSIQEVYQNQMRPWHNESKRFEGCKGCEYIDMCESGCQMISAAVNGETATKDPLYVGPNNVKKHFRLVTDDKIYKAIKNNEKFKVRDSLRFRQEKGFMLVNIRWGNTISVSNDLGNFLLEYMKNQKFFTIKEFGEENVEWLANLFFKDVIIAEKYNFNDDRSMMGVSANIDHIPFIKKIGKIKANHQKSRE